MPMPSEAELLAQGDHVRCKCHNVIPLSAIFCPFCRGFNAATSSQTCPTCGQSLAQTKE